MDFTFPQPVIPNVWAELILSLKAMDRLGLGGPDEHEPYCWECGRPFDADS